MILHPVEIDGAIVAELNAMLTRISFRTRRTWTIEVDESAPVYVTHTNSAFVRNARNARASGAKPPRLLVIYGTDDPPPRESPKLQYPFRLMPVLEAILELEAIGLDGADAAPLSTKIAGVIAPAADVQLVVADRFAAKLRDSSSATKNEHILVGRYPDGAKLVAKRAAGMFFANDDAIEHLKRGRLPTSVAVHENPAVEPRFGRAFPLAELLWCTGLAIGSSASASVSNAVLTLLRSPPFGRFDSMAPHLKLAAELTHRPSTIEQLVQATAIDRSVVARFAAACIYAGFARAERTALRAVPAISGQPRTPPPMEDKSTLQRLFRGVRAKFGLGLEQ